MGIHNYKGLLTQRGRGLRGVVIILTPHSWLGIVHWSRPAVVCPSTIPRLSVLRLLSFHQHQMISQYHPLEWGRGGGGGGRGRGGKREEREKREGGGGGGEKRWRREMSGGEGGRR